MPLDSKESLLKYMDSTEKESITNLYYEIPPSREEAEAIQRELQKKVITQNGFKEINKIAGADLAPIQGEERLVCGIIVFSFPELEELERVWQGVMKSSATKAPRHKVRNMCFKKVESEARI